MRNAYGSYLMFIIVIAFVLLFTGYICISINQSKAFNVKNEIVKAIERNSLNGTEFSDTTKDLISETLSREGYRIEGNCSDGYDGYDREGNFISQNANGAAFCILPIRTQSGKLTGTYYKVETFYQLDLPAVSSIFNLRATGETKIIYGSVNP